MDDAARMSAPMPSAASQMLTPLDIQQKEFRVGTRGYRMREVDEFLDQLTDAMSAVLAENERLRAGSPAGPAIGTADLDDTNRQADEIIQRARDEAQRIVADARAQAAAAAGAGVATAADRPAVAAFLAQEREFLQGLAGLVQGHAESVKAMAKTARQAPTETSATVDPARAEKVAAPEPAKAEPSEPVKADTAPELPKTPTHDPSEPAAQASAEPVVLQQPASASVGRAETTEAAEGDSSLRELFWGED